MQATPMMLSSSGFAWLSTSWAGEPSPLTTGAYPIFSNSYCISSPNPILHLPEDVPPDSQAQATENVPCCGRGCGGVPLTTPKIFCQADTSDIYLSVREIRSQFPQAPIFAIGFSLGGYTLNKYLGQVDTAVYGPGQHTKPTSTW